MTSKDSMRDQASQIWAFLDDLQKSDPADYKRFIDKQMKEGKERSAPPEPHMCAMTNSQRGRVYLNICGWQRIPYPKSDEDPIPVMGGTPYTEEDSEGPYECITLAFNPKILEEYGIESSLYQEQKMMINLALDYYRDQHKTEVSRTYTLHPASTRYKGDLSKLKSSIMNMTKDQDDAFEQELDGIKNEFAPAGIPDSLLSELSNMSMGKEPKNQKKPAGNYNNIDLDSFKQKEPEITLSKHTEKRAGLIEEISSDAVSVREPEYKLEEKPGQNGCPGKLLVKVKLPGVTSVSDCVLEIEKDLFVEVEGQYKLTLPLPDTVAGEAGSAKFSKRSSTLTVTFPMKETAS